MTPVSETDCPNKHCDVALQVQGIYGEIKSQLATGAEVMRSLGASQRSTCDRMQGLLDKYERRQETIEKECEDRIDKLSKRIDRLEETTGTRHQEIERKVWWASGALAALIFAYNIIKAYIPGGKGGG